AEDYVHRIGRTARLGEEGDAISFACERYAIGLPDIEAYIEQKIPSARVEPELLIAIPRPVREKVEGEEEESVGAIFKEAREARAAEEERRGGGRSRSGGPGAGGRGGPPRREGGPAERRPRRESSADAAAQKTSAADAAVAPAAVAGTSEAAGVAAPEVPATGEATRPPRKRRRRRGGRKIEGQPVEGGQQSATPVATTRPATPAKPQAPAHATAPAPQPRASGSNGQSRQVPANKVK